MKVVIENHIPYIKGLLEPVASRVVYAPASDITRELVRDAQVLLTRTRTRCDAALLGGSTVEFVGTATIGTDHIDMEYCRSHGITVASAPGCNAPAVAQWVMATLAQWLEARRLQPDGITLGVVGVGHVGSIVARWARQLGMRVLLNDPPRASREGPDAFVTLDHIKRHCDVVTFHTPLTRQGRHATWHLCDARFLDGARAQLVMNAARGGIADEEALLAWHGDVAIDCWEGEPAIGEALLERAFVATPHIAGYSRQGKLRGTAQIIEALNAHYGWHLTPPMADTPAAGAASVTLAGVLASYDPLADTALLKARHAPALFEELRNHYNLREEVKE